MDRVFLIGYMGSGKTTIGKLLAEKMEMQFIDLDHFIENRYRKSIREIFTEKGEEAFREIEHEALVEVASFENAMISTGGGTPCFYDNMALMNQLGTTVYFRVSIDELANRLDRSKQNRPLIRDKNSKELREFIALGLEKREPVYLQASLVFDANKRLVTSEMQDVFADLIHQLQRK